MNTFSFKKVKLQSLLTLRRNTGRYSKQFIIFFCYLLFQLA